MKFYGIDPGINGALACIDTDKYPRVDITILPFKDKTLAELWSTFDLIFNRELGDVRVILERVHALPGRFRGSISSWVLAESFSAVKTLLTVYKVPFESVLPEKWQSALNLHVKKSKNKVDKKKINLEKAQALFPGPVHELTRDTADSLLIAEYARRTN